MKRIKRAIAAFFREELLEYIDYSHTIPFTNLNDRFVVEKVDFETVAMEKSIPIQRNTFEDARYLEEEIQQAKEYFARQILEHIHVDAQNLTRPDYYGRRSVKFVLRVQAKNGNKR